MFKFGFNFILQGWNTRNWAKNIKRTQRAQGKAQQSVKMPPSRPKQDPHAHMGQLAPRSPTACCPFSTRASSCLPHTKAPTRTRLPHSSSTQVRAPFHQGTAPQVGPASLSPANSCQHKCTTIGPRAGLPPNHSATPGELPFFVVNAIILGPMNPCHVSVPLLCQ